MTDQEFLALNTEVERLQALHEASLNDPDMDINERRAITDEYMRKSRELNEEGLRRIALYKDTD
ncbi:MAG: hypothetical protein E6556_15760 [Pantoea sp.]|nr:hypothetical protein [Pantoea sp.]